MMRFLPNGLCERVLEFTGERIVPQADNCEPNFASRMFHEHMARYLFAGQLVTGKAVLDVGCGVGYGAQKLGQLGAASVFAFDISSDAIEHARRFYAHPAVRFGVGNAEAFALDEQFDVVTCFEMIEHVNHPDRVLECIARHLRPDGILVASTPRFLGEKRTHFHVREFSLDEYRKLIEASFQNTKIYSENNHFCSAVTDDSPRLIDRIQSLKEQYSPDQADVFISVSALSGEVPLPDMVPSLVLDDDNYVRMLERDVAILHKAEDDLRALLAAEREAAADARTFLEAEVARLVREYGEVFQRAEDLGSNRWTLEQEFAAYRASAEQAGLARDAEIARIEGEYNALFRRAEDEARERFELEQRFSAHSAAAEEAGAGKDAEIARLVDEYKDLFRRFEDEARERFELEQRFSVHRVAAEEAGAEKDAEIARLADEYNDLFRKAEAESAGHAEALQKSLEMADLHGQEVRRLTEDRDALRGELEIVVASLKDAEMKFGELQDEHDKLRSSIDAMAVRAQDADARRLEAYEFARTSGEAAQALRRELDILKRDLLEALETPASVTGQANVDHKHRAVVESMERIFLGTAATHQLARDPLVVRVGKLGCEAQRLATELDAKHEEVRRLAAELDARQAEASEQRGRAEQAEAFAEDWHAQILRLRKTASWKLTTPLRAIGRVFR